MYFSIYQCAVIIFTLRNWSSLVVFDGMWNIIQTYLCYRARMTKKFKCLYMNIQNDHFLANFWLMFLKINFKKGNIIHHSMQNYAECRFKVYGTIWNGFATECARKHDRYRNDVFSKMSNFKHILFLATASLIMNHKCVWTARVLLFQVMYNMHCREMFQHKNDKICHFPMFNGHWLRFSPIYWRMWCVK